MYLLDTNVVSELRRPEKANPKVLGWAGGLPAAAFFLSVITVLEVELGILMIVRRDARQGALLRTWMDERLLPGFEGRVLPVDTVVAQRCAGLHVPDKRAERDALIAATALVHGMTVVTRNGADFQATGVSILDPWT